MRKENTLDEINDENKVNQTISRDEEKRSPENHKLALSAAEEIILELPDTNDKAVNWLKTYGKSARAKQLRES